MLCLVCGMFVFVDLVVRIRAASHVDSAVPQQMITHFLFFLCVCSFEDPEKKYDTGLVWKKKPQLFSAPLTHTFSESGFHNISYLSFDSLFFRHC